MEGPQTFNKLFVGLLCICSCLIGITHAERYSSLVKDSQPDGRLLSKEQQLKEYLQILKAVLEDIGPDNVFDGGDLGEKAFMEGKRAPPSGFMGVRGKKFSIDAFSGIRGKKDSTSENEKRLGQDGFFGVRGKKSPPAGFSSSRGKRDPPRGFFGMRGKKSPPSGFFGMRGKKASPQSGFYGIRGKKIPPVGFVVARGKRLEDTQDQVSEHLQNQLLKTTLKEWRESEEDQLQGDEVDKREPASRGFQAMRGRR